MKQVTLRRVVTISLFGNILLTIIKLIFGHYGQSKSLFSDGINSFVDIFISLMLLIVIRLSLKEPDDNHPYGHQKFEGVIYIFLSIFIIGIALFLGYDSIKSLLDIIHKPATFKTPQSYTILVAVISLGIKIFLFIINYKTAAKFRSVALYADSKNHLFDICSTSISLISILFSFMGMIYFESIASIIITLFILYAGFKMILDAISFLVDEAPPKAFVDEIRDSILSLEGVLNLDDLKVRKHMAQFYVDVEISVERSLSLESAHLIAENVHNHIEKEFDVIHCMVHVNPSKQTKKA